MEKPWCLKSAERLVQLQLHLGRHSTKPVVVLSRSSMGKHLGDPGTVPSRPGKPRAPCQPRDWLVVEPTHLKNMLVKLEIFPNFRGENAKNIWNHHLDNIGFTVSLCGAKKIIQNLRKLPGLASSHPDRSASKGRNRTCSIRRITPLKRCRERTKIGHDAKNAPSNCAVYMLAKTRFPRRAFAPETRKLGSSFFCSKM